jgi:hypothetical protein
MARAKEGPLAGGTFVGSTCFLALGGAWNSRIDYLMIPATYKCLQNAPSRFGRSAKPLCVEVVS